MVTRLMSIATAVIQLSWLWVKVFLVAIVFLFKSESDASHTNLEGNDSL